MTTATLWQRIEFDAIKVKLRVAILRYNRPWV